MIATADTPAQPQTLKRELGLFGATMMGLGAIVGTGVFVSIGIAAGITGPAVIVAIAIAALVATFNALNSAQLAASHPVSGGTYEYGYKYLHPALGFTAGWMFLCAKSASAATAALGFAGYFLHATGIGSAELRTPIAVLAVVLLTGIVLSGLQRSNRVNVVIVSVTLSALILFCVLGTPTAYARGGENLRPFFGTMESLLHATALMFVAFTGYGRIATMSEEVREPRRTIPRAIIVTLLVTSLLYMAVAVVAMAAVGAGALNSSTQSQVAPLEIVSRAFGVPHFHLVIAVGAMTAMLGVLLNLVLGLSRMLLAMGRRGDMPKVFGKLNAAGTTPVAAVIMMGVVIASLTLIGNVKTTWSFSAFTVLIYYAITNLAALRLPAEQRLYSPLIAWGGLAACLFLAFWVQREVWLAGLALIVVGLCWQFLFRRILANRA